MFKALVRKFPGNYKSGVYEETFRDTVRKHNLLGCKHELEVTFLGFTSGFLPRKPGCS